MTAAASASPGGMISGENSGGLPGHYLVRLRDTTPVQRTDIINQVKIQAHAHGGTVNWSAADRSGEFSVQLPPAGARELAADPRVAWVQEQREYRVEDDQTGLYNWGLDSIGKRSLPLNGKYGYMGTAGSGVHVYVVDTGIRISNPQFQGRASYGINTVPGTDPKNADDCQGHGTHVAGIVGSRDYGVAKKASLVAVRVFDCSGLAEDPQIIAGLQWIEAHAIKPAVVNMSLGSVCVGSLGPTECPVGTSAGIVTEEQKLINTGVPIVTSAGNDGANACYNPVGAAGSSINVGAVNPSQGYHSPSNFGKCVDIWAPGESISSVGGVGKDASGTIDPDPVSRSGTSAAAPHVAGAVAILMGTPQFAQASPAQIKARLDATSTLGKIINLPDTLSPNKLLYSPPSQEGAPVALAKITSGPLAGSLEGFGTDADGRFLFATRKLPDVPGWSGWTASTSLGWLSAGADNNVDGSTELIGITTSNQVWQRQVRGGTMFSPWTQLPGISLQSVAVTHNQNGLVELVGITPQGQLVVTSQTSPNALTFFAWAPFPGPLPQFDSVSAEMDGANLIEIFAVDTHSRVWQAKQTVPNNNIFQSFTPMPGSDNMLISELAVARQGDGHLNLVGSNASGLVSHRTQMDTGDFAPWSPLARMTLSHLAAETDSDGRVVIAGVDTTGALWSSRQSSSDPNVFAAWSALAGALRS
ncbi:S8 family serine peptidase [Kribbella sp. NBC_00359]|uniref:S8 family serine peptidase n=1 Tax=Kribbella sp. NBC_00359 TaxID=2975966 RepID=UPI002E23A73D